MIIKLILILAEILGVFSFGFDILLPLVNLLNILFLFFRFLNVLLMLPFFLIFLLNFLLSFLLSRDGSFLVFFESRLYFENLLVALDHFGEEIIRSLDFNIFLFEKFDCPFNIPQSALINHQFSQSFCVDVLGLGFIHVNLCV